MKPPQHVTVKRSDAIYMAHAYLTKVPVAAIVPFIERFSRPGDVVLDPFAGSGMTGVAAAMTGRRARLFDVSVLGRHIGSNYVRLVDPAAYRRAADAVEQKVRERLPRIYSHRCSRCGREAELSRRVISVVFSCQTCTEPVNYYHALEAAGMRKAHAKCPSCGAAIDVRVRVGEEPVSDTVNCVCSSTLFDQEPTQPLGASVLPDGLTWPTTPIDPERQMFQASALGKHGLTSIDRFFSERNLYVLAALRAAITDEHNDNLRHKLLFAFTAILPRSSKRYQWGPARPLNAATHNYYIAPVFFEWNPLDLFSRKVNAIIRSDDEIRSAAGGMLFNPDIDVSYEIASADDLPLESRSVDYVFTDPPFGSNIFYSDMNLFQEAWLGSLTDPSRETVVDRRGSRSSERYERLIKDALGECARVLKPSGHMSLVFSNSKGEMWALVQRAIRDAGLELVPDGLTVLDKGQRSVKGLNSGHEGVVTSDLILTMRQSAVKNGHDPAPLDMDQILQDVMSQESHPTPSHLYLDLIKRCLRDYVDVSGLSYSRILSRVDELGLSIDEQSGRFASLDRLRLHVDPEAAPSKPVAVQLNLSDSLR